MNTGIARAGCKLSRGFEEHILDWGATVLQSNGCSLGPVEGTTQHKGVQWRRPDMQSPHSLLYCSFVHFH